MKMNMALISYVLLGMIVAMSTRKVVSSDYFPGPNGDPNSPAALFNRDTQKCCKGTAHPLHSLHRCCGNTTYDFTEQICCQSSPQKLTAGVRTQCCGAKAYDVKLAMCCERKLTILPEGADRELYKCCYDRMYDSRSHLCCGYEVVKKSSPKYNAKCCGMKSYIPDIEVCCEYGQNVLPKNWTNTGCCSEKTFNKDTHMCCNGVITESNKPNSTCCGTTPYNPQTEICCKDKVSVNVDGEASCCGDQGYHYRNQVCCSEEVHTINSAVRWSYYCCGEKLMNTDTHICVQGQKIVNRTSQYMQSCGEEMYNSETQLCCYYNNSEKVHDKGNSPSLMCCGAAVVDPEDKQICCYGEYSGYNPTPHDIEKPTMQCCDSDVYDPEMSICCQGKIHPKIVQEDGSTGASICCNKELYNPSKEMCCDGKVLKIKDPESKECCSSYETDEKNNCNGPYPDHPYPIDNNNVAYAYGSDHQVVEI